MNSSIEILADFISQCEKGAKSFRLRKIELLINRLLRGSCDELDALYGSKGLLKKLRKLIEDLITDEEMNPQLSRKIFSGPNGLAAKFENLLNGEFAFDELNKLCDDFGARILEFHNVSIEGEVRGEILNRLNEIMGRIEKCNKLFNAKIGKTFGKTAKQILDEKVIESLRKIESRIDKKDIKLLEAIKKTKEIVFEPRQVVMADIVNELKTGRR